MLGFTQHLQASKDATHLRSEGTRFESQSDYRLLRLIFSASVAHMSEMRDLYKILVGKPEWKRPRGRPRRRWEDNVRIYLREIGWEVADWMHLAQDRDQLWAVVNTVMNLRVP